MKQLLILIIVFIPIVLMAQFGSVGDAAILYTLANGTFTESSGVNYFEFDIMAQATPEEQGGLTRFGDGLLYLYYNTDAFGIDLYTHHNVAVSLGELTTSPYPGVDFYLIHLNDTAGHGGDPVLLAITLEFISNEGNGGVLPAEPIQLVHVKFVIQDTSEIAWVCLWVDEMIGESFYDDHWTYYNNVEVGNCIYYDPPLPVELSTFTASMNITNDAVNLMWVTQTESNMIGYRILRGNSDVLAEAEDQNTLIPATNTSQPVSYMYSDTVIQPEQSYYYWLEALDMDGTNTFFGPIAITVPGEGEYTPVIPLATGISSLYPNPFNPDLTISYSVKTSLPVKIDIVNMRGQIIQTLVNENKEAGVYRQNWNGTGSDGRLCSSGVYFVRMQAGGEEYYAKAILLK
jgi:hypothetical protein